MQICVKNLHKSYEQSSGEALSILKGIDLEVDRGESLSIVGASGAGKTTFLQVLGGLDTPSSGEVSIAGQSLQQMTRQQLAGFRNEQIGFVFQFHHLLNEFTALENVMMPMRIARMATSDAQKKATQLLEKVGLAHRLQHRPAQLSGGEQQRVAIARAIANGPLILLADEPTGNLDLETGQQVMDMIYHLNQESQLTLILITHNPDIAKRAQKHYHIVDGQLRPYPSSIPDEFSCN